jgi:hypothetical protein
MFGPRLVVVLGRAHAVNVVPTPLLDLALASQVSVVWSAAEAAALALSRETARAMLLDSLPAKPLTQS